MLNLLFYFRFLILFFIAVGLASQALALELQGIVTNQCTHYIGVPVSVNSTHVFLLKLDGHVVEIPRASIESVSVFNVIENPFSSITVDDRSLPFLKKIYLDDGPQPTALAFAVRFIEDLTIFYSVTDGRMHVHSQSEIDRLRPATLSDKKTYRPSQFKSMTFQFTDASGKCALPTNVNEKGIILPTRVLADQIGLADLYSSSEHGYEGLDGFQERTYLYAKPYLFPKSSRLGLVMDAKPEEAGAKIPMYFQWSTGQPYRFQSFTVIGSKPHEFLPNAEPVFAVRSDVKSHIFHGLFIGNIMGMPAGNPVFLTHGYLDDLNKNLTVQPGFNYLAMMGGDFGPYSASVGFFYPTYGFKVGNYQREVLGSSLNYAVRAMYTHRQFRFRVIGSMAKYNREHATKSDVLTSFNKTQGDPPSSFNFKAVFLRPGVDWDLDETLRLTLDGIFVHGDYSEINNGIHNTVNFSRITTQMSLQKAFGEYVNLIGYVDMIQNDYKANFEGQGLKDQVHDVRYFGTLEFIF